MIDKVFQSQKEHGLLSVYPCTQYLTFGPWLYLVPQFQPDDICILGYGGGTAAGLIRMFYGDIPITGVDIEHVRNIYHANLVKADARDYVRGCPHFDVMVVDLFMYGVPCPFVFDESFAGLLKAKCNYLIVHASDTSDMKPYSGLYKVKTLALDSKRFHYYAIGPCHKLPVR